jgi:putative heme-binding domain-containing protein
MIRDQGTYKAGDVESKAYWFRPSDVAVGTDGAIYVSDWYDPRVGGHQMLETEGYGRIFRIAPKGKELRAPELNLSTTEGQIEALLNPAQNVRYMGFWGLEAQGEAVLDEVKAILEADNPYHRARAVWLLARLGPQGVHEVEQLLGASDPQMRAVAFRALRQVQEQEDVLAHARQLASDDSPALRREVAIFLRDVPLDQSKEIMIELAEQYEGNDRWMLESYGLAAEGEEEAVYELLKGELGNADPMAWTEPWADLVWRLHPETAVDVLQARAGSPEMSEENRNAAMVALGFIHDLKAVTAMEELAQSDQPEVAERAQWWLDYRRTNEWHGLKDWADIEKTEEEQRLLQQVQDLQKTVLEEETPAQDRIAAARTLAESAEGGRLLMSLIIDDQLPADVQQAASAQIFENPDRTVRVLAAHYLERSEQDTALAVEQVANLEGDPERGQMVFYTKCAVCHRAGMTGGDVGPDLTGVKNMFNQAGLADAIIHPGSGIAHGYAPVAVKTTDGEVTYGFLQAENDATVVVKDANGAEHVIDRERIDSQETLELTLMPGPAELELSEQDVADLVEFLMGFEAE